MSAISAKEASTLVEASFCAYQMANISLILNHLFGFIYFLNHFVAVF